MPKVGKREGRNGHPVQDRIQSRRAARALSETCLFRSRKCRWSISALLVSS